MFNLRPQVQVVPLYEGRHCLVIDNALREPQRWVDWACAQRAHFTPSAHAYPGLELWLAEGATARFGDYFAQHVRGRLGARRTLTLANRLSLVTVAPDDLLPRQRLCHRDNPGMVADQCVVASVIYLFHDPRLGGTSFFRPRRSPEQTEQMAFDARLLDGDRFAQRYPELGSGYMAGSNDWFEQVATVDAAWNRAIFYDGGIYHSGAIAAPERLSADPARGRLTMNGFMHCRRQAS